MKYQYWCAYCGKEATTDTRKRPSCCDRRMKAVGREDKRLALPHPMQPIEDDGNDVVRFKPNEIVRWMLDQGEQGNKFDLNTVARQKFRREDREQLAQLIGYSVSGFGDLSYASEEAVALADQLSEPVIERMQQEQDQDDREDSGKE